MPGSGRWRAILGGLALACALFAPHAAMAESYLYDHNSSLMRVVSDGASVRITYEQPREGLSGAGVQPGTVLFEGGFDGPDVVSGMANAFSSRCGTIDYYVHGDFLPGADFVLRGAAPVRDRETCRIIDNSTESANAILGFTFVGRAGDADATRFPAPVDLPASGGSACIRAPGETALRTGPGLFHGVLATYAAGTCGFIPATPERDGFVGVTRDQAAGWLPVSALGR